MQRPDQFWMVYGDGQGSPTCRHPSQADASREAKRLAKAHPDIAFFVLETIECVIKKELFTINYRAAETDDIPF